MKIFISFFFVIGVINSSFAQENKIILQGSVSYITGQNIYVKFSNTQGIENGDTLFMLQNEKLIPVLLVQHHSSISCLCNPIGTNNLKVSDKIIGKINIENQKVISEQTNIELPEKDINEEVLTSEKEPKIENTKHQNLNGRLSLSSYSNISNSDAENTHRFRYTFSMKAEDIADSKVSTDTYISFTHKLNHWDLVQEDLNNALKIYSLALKYDFNESVSVWAGRKINPKIANVGAIDGIQFQYGFKNMFVGAVAGSRPDYRNYGYNFDLFEFGAYLGQSQKVKNGYLQTSLALFEQRNQSNTDRRFTYFQHTNSAIKNLNLFSSFELDLYKLENGLPKNTLSLTSLYLSASYRMSKRISLFGSYDNRKNVIYYETFRNYSEEVLQQASRQGLRFRINYRPIHYLILGLNAGTRFRKEDARPTNTLIGTATYSKVPLINASLSLSANLMQTSYLDGQIYGARLTKDLIPGKIYSVLNYRFVQFNYANVNSQLTQHIGEIDFSYQFNKKLYMSVNLESTFQKQENYNRIYINLRRKF